MKLRVGFEMLYEFPQPTPMIMVLGTHFTRASDVIVPDLVTTKPSVPHHPLSRPLRQLVQPHRRAGGQDRLTADAHRARQRPARRCAPDAMQQPSKHLPEETLVYLLGSRYCETDQLSDIAWQLFGTGPPGWARVQAICDFVHHHITFGYQHARRPRRRGRRTTKASASAATTPTWRSRSAAA